MKARLRSVKAWIEDRLCDPSLSSEPIARNNSISRCYLHALFRLEGQSVSNWIWTRRLQQFIAFQHDGPSPFRHPAVRHHARQVVLERGSARGSPGAFPFTDMQMWGIGGGGSQKLAVLQTQFP